MQMLEAVLVRPWPFWIAGLAIGAFVTTLAWMTGKALGVSSGYAEMCTITRAAGPERWKLYFALGLPLGGLAAMLGTSLASGADATSIGWTLDLPLLRQSLGIELGGELALLAVGGVFIGYGARLAGGCTSGHSIVGIALGSKASIVATLGFMAAGVATTQILFRVIGDLP